MAVSAVPCLRSMCMLLFGTVWDAEPSIRPSVHLPLHRRAWCASWFHLQRLASQRLSWERVGRWVYISLSFYLLKQVEAAVASVPPMWSVQPTPGLSHSTRLHRRHNAAQVPAACGLYCSSHVHSTAIEHQHQPDSPVPEQPELHSTSIQTKVASLGRSSRRTDLVS